MKRAARRESRSGHRAGTGTGAGRARAGQDRAFLDFVLDQLRGLRGVEGRAMFGGYGLYRDATFFAIVHRGRLYFRTSETTRAEFEARDMAPFRPGPRQTLKRYYEVPAEVLEDAAQAVRWARAAVGAGAESRP